jgi:O-antigen/teichoic acid export membrane protein
MMVVNLAAFPVTVAMYERAGLAATRDQLRKYFLALSAIALPAATGLAILAPNITGVVLAPQFAAEARAIVPPVTLAILFGGIKSYYFDLSFQLGERTGWQLLVVILAATVNFVLNLLWIPQYGAPGAAYATLAAYFTSLVASWTLGRWVLALPVPFWGLCKVAGASLVMALALLVVRDYAGPIALIGQIALGVMAYAAAAVAFDVGGVRRLLVSRFRSGAR